MNGDAVAAMNGKNAAMNGRLVDVERDGLFLDLAGSVDRDDFDDGHDGVIEVFIEEDINPAMKFLTLEEAFDLKDRVGAILKLEPNECAVDLLTHDGSCGSVDMMNGAIELGYERECGKHENGYLGN